MKFIILPAWLLDKLDDNRLDRKVCLDQQRLRHILSDEELSFYLYMNSSSFYSRLSSLTCRKTIHRLMTDICSSNSLTTAFQCANRPVDIYTRAVDIMSLVMGPNVFSNHNEKTPHMLWLKPVLFSTDTIGFIPQWSEYKNKDNCRRDIYDIMHRFLSTEQLIASPLFGL